MWSQLVFRGLALLALSVDIECYGIPHGNLWHVPTAHLSDFAGQTEYNQWSSPMHFAGQIGAITQASAS